MNTSEVAVVYRYSCTSLGTLLLDRGISGEIVVTRFIVYVRIEIEMF